VGPTRAAESNERQNEYFKFKKYIIFCAQNMFGPNKRKFNM